VELGILSGVVDVHPEGLLRLFLQGNFFLILAGNLVLSIELTVSEIERMWYVLRYTCGSSTNSYVISFQAGTPRLLNVEVVLGRKYGLAPYPATIECLPRRVEGVSKHGLHRWTVAVRLDYYPIAVCIYNPWCASHTHQQAGHAITQRRRSPCSCYRWHLHYPRIIRRRRKTIMDDAYSELMLQSQSSRTLK